MTDLHTRAVTLADADGTAPDVAEMIHDLLDALKALRAADEYIDKGHFQMARNITRAALAATKGATP